MPSYGSLGSPSLRKEAGISYNNRPSMFNVGYVLGNPFALATIGVSMVAWMIAFISSIIADARDSFPNFAWWAIVYMFMCIGGITLSVATDTEDMFSVSIVGFLAAGLVFTTSAVNSLVYSSDAAKESAAAGFILLSMVAIIWILYYGATANAAHRRAIDSFALHKSDRSAHADANAAATRNSRPMSHTFGSSHQDNSMTAANNAPQMVPSNQLNAGGFETSSPVSGYPGGPIGAGDANRNSSQPRFGGAGTMSSQANGGPIGGENSGEGDGGAPTEYAYRAKAMYSYEADPNDANEISFQKHEILEVSDVSGRWWQARKENGETGIAPSNYLILL
ncbi:hypothetical protein BDY21DRAFT_113265 [Lineolata rhizophorae]|uniref:SH3 domain-containing protein n=1 Tax=Lineolata rhizophorae TaxID=578093 RepID=A0A6A6NQU9_9PEZI|nr:hypothetical protein BDY21DRAFT_113265 [Lineolata rhizophorae]